MANQVIDVILQPGPSHFQFFDLLVRREIDFLLYSINGIVQTMIFIKHFPEMVISAFQAPDDLAMFRKLSQYWVMQVHGMIHSSLTRWFRARLNRPGQRNS